MSDEKKDEPLADKVDAPSGPEGAPDAHNEHGTPGVRPNSTVDGEVVDGKPVPGTDES